MGTEAAAGSRFTAAFFNQYYGFADTAQTTVTQATQQPLATAYAIPANEPIAGSAYQVHFGGNGTWGSTQQLISFTLVVQGVVVVNAINGIAAATFSANAGFRFAGYADLVFSSTGPTGGVVGSLSYTLTESANAVNPGTASTNTAGISDSAGPATLDTTSVMNVQVKCGWASTTGAPTITNKHTIFRKVA